MLGFLSRFAVVILFAVVALVIYGVYRGLTNPKDVRDSKQEVRDLKATIRHRDHFITILREEAWTYRDIAPELSTIIIGKIADYEREQEA